MIICQVTLHKGLLYQVVRWDQGLAGFSWKELDSKYFKHYKPKQFLPCFLLLYNSWTMWKNVLSSWTVHNKAPGRIWPVGCHLLTPRFYDLPNLLFFDSLKVPIMYFIFRETDILGRIFLEGSRDVQELQRVKQIARPDSKVTSADLRYAPCNAANTSLQTGKCHLHRTLTHVSASLSQDEAHLIFTEAHNMRESLYQQHSTS